jgi:hypothetical protein
MSNGDFQWCILSARITRPSAATMKPTGPTGYPVWKRLIRCLTSRLCEQAVQRRQIFTKQLLREIGGHVDEDRVKRIKESQGEALERMSEQIRPLPGAHALLVALTEANIPWGDSGHFRVPHLLVQRAWI